MAVQAYITDSSGGSKVTLTIDPSPIPWIKFSGGITSRRTLNTRSGDDIEPGTMHHYLAGTSVSAGIIEVACQCVTRSVYTSLVALIAGAGCGQVQFSPDNGTTTYNCVMAADEMDLSPIDGTSDLLEGKIILHLVSVEA